MPRDFSCQLDLKGRITSSVDTRLNTLNATYTQNTDGSVQTTETDDPDVTDPQFVPSLDEFDRDGRLLLTRTETGVETLLGYDGDSEAPNFVLPPDPGRHTITIQRDPYGRPTRIKDPDNIGGQDETIEYDTATHLQVTATTDALGRREEWHYFTSGPDLNCVSFDRQQLDGRNLDTTYTYTPSGALQTVTDPAQKTTTFHYDALDRLDYVQDASGVRTSYEHDTLGRLWRVHAPLWKGQANDYMEYHYDDHDRVTDVYLPNGARMVHYDYDPIKGWLTDVTDVLGRVTHFVCDPVTGDVLEAHEIQAGQPDRVTMTTYDRFGDVQTITPPGSGPITFDTDDLGRPTGGTEVDSNPPGVPKFLTSNHASDNVATRETNHIMSWGAPDSDSGVAGYSFALDSAPDNVIDSANAAAFLNGVSVGNHTFQVKAKGNNGLWGQIAVFHLNIVGGGLPGHFPDWWIERNVVDPNATPKDYALALQGQVKAMAVAAYQEIKTRLPPGDNSAIEAALSTFTQRGNYAPLNQGQLKALAKPFYDRIVAAAAAFPNDHIRDAMPEGMTGDYPWTAATADDQNYAPVNIGQVKYVFSFNFDRDNDGLPDWWEWHYFPSLGLSTSPSADPDGDGVSNWMEYQYGTSPAP
jgi:YD repeat-containing protein